MTGSHNETEVSTNLFYLGAVLETEQFAGLNGPYNSALSLVF